MRAILIAVVVLLVVTSVVVAQTNKGGISGTVVDPNGAAVPGATVIITNAGTGQKVTVTTSESGAFSVQSLDPVTYRVLVEAPGFNQPQSTTPAGAALLAQIRGNVKRDTSTRSARRANRWVAVGLLPYSAATGLRHA
jgi:hypothetical protein